MPVHLQERALPRPHAAPFHIALPAAQTAPLVFASPHSGRAYPPDFLGTARLDATGLRRSEDCFVDELFGWRDRRRSAATDSDVRAGLLRSQPRTLGTRSGHVRRRPA